jgi:hypothetical protein
VRCSRYRVPTPQPSHTRCGSLRATAGSRRTMWTVGGSPTSKIVMPTSSETPMPPQRIVIVGSSRLSVPGAKLWSLISAGRSRARSPYATPSPLSANWYDRSTYSPTTANCADSKRRLSCASVAIRLPVRRIPGTPSVRCCIACDRCGVKRRGSRIFRRACGSLSNSPRKTVTWV